MTDLHLRPAVPGDEPELGRLAGILVRMHSAWNPRRFLTIDDVDAGYGRWLGKEARDPHALVVVAERGPEIIGYLYARFERRDFNQLLGPHAVLHDILVDESARHAGVGRALIDRLKSECAARRTPRVVLHTAVQNEAGQQLFAQAGFEPTMIELTCELPSS